MGYDNDQDEIVLGELDDVTGPSEAEAEAAATEEIDDSQLSPEDSMRRRSAARREERDRKRSGGGTRAERREDRRRIKERRKELSKSSPDTGKGRRIAMIAVALVLCVSLVGGGVYYFYLRGRNSGMQAAMTGPDASMDFGNITIVSASGTTSIGMSLETFDLNLSDVDLTIDEVYVSNRDEVEEHQAILKINEDSIEDARVRLQQTAQSAEYAYQLNEIDAQKDVVTAKDTYEQALIALEYAEQDYADTVSEAQAEIDSLQRQVDEQQEKVDEYQAAVNDAEYYAKQNKVPELKAQLQKDMELLQSIYDDDSTRVAEHLDFVYGGSYEAWLNDEEFDNSSSSSGGGMPGGGDFGGGMPGGGSGDSGSGSGTGSSDAGSGSGSGSGTGSSGSGTTGGSGTGSGSTDGSGSGSSGDAGSTGTDGSSTSGSTDGSGTTGNSIDSSDSTSTQSSDSTTSEVVDNETTGAGREIRVYSLSSGNETVTSETVNNEVYYTEAPSGASGSMPSGAASGSASGTTSASSAGGSSSSSSSSSGATITDLYVGASSVDTSKALSTSSLSKDDLVYFPWYAAYVALSEEVTEEAQELETAEQDAERDQSRASSLLSQAENRLESLQLKLRTAQNDLITTTEEAQETLDTVRAEATAAQETYNTSIRSIENTADTLKDAMDTADENLEAFEEQIGDGYLYTSNAGTIMMVGVEEGDTLSYNAMIAAYTDPGTISVSAAVDQSYIASITVGDTVAVVFDEAGIYQGYVAAINPVTQSSSRTSVTYSVTVELEGDVSEVEENISATVYFGDAVPLVFQQAGDLMHSPDATTDTGADSTSSSGSASSGSDDADSALETLIDQTDADIENAEAAAEAGTTAADTGDAALADDGTVTDGTSAVGAMTGTATGAATGNVDVGNGVAVADTTADSTATAAGDTDTITSEGQ